MTGGGRRLLPTEMAQIAGRAGRHQKDGTFGTLAGGAGHGAQDAEFEDEEIYAIEEHKFAP
jgi:ATP-dependent RNA helicase SUPV3L1/SUV3